MSIKAIAWAWEQELPATTKLVLLALADCSHPETGATFPSQGYLAQKTGVSRQSVNLHLAKLEELGLISSERTFDENGRELNKRYVLNFIPRCLAGRHTGVKEPDTGGVKQLDTEPRVEEPEVGTLDISVKSLRIDFALFWRNYPRHVGKDAANLAFVKAVKRGHDPVEIVRKAAEFRVHCTRNQRAIQFIPHPSTWLNQGRWQDELVDDQEEVVKKEDVRSKLIQHAAEIYAGLAGASDGQPPALPERHVGKLRDQSLYLVSGPRRIRGPGDAGGDEYGDDEPPLSPGVCGTEYVLPEDEE